MISEVIILIAAFTGWFYYFDDQNRYVRTKLFILWYLIPLLISLLMLSVILQYYKELQRGVRISLLIFTIAPLIAAAVQVVAYGLSLTNISMVGTVILLYIFALLDLNGELERASKREIEIMRDEQTRLRVMFEQTAGALSSSIDAKDRYTHGHSKRVAEYSERIAKAAGMSKEECEEIYFAALLHDVGKIGIPDSIINKEGRLTDEEFDIIKTHPVIGNQILSMISQSPYLSIGAYYHHERYDGRGYPKGLKGEDIPALARIIGVADAYDAMTSKRSYRDPLPQYFVREEFVKGIGVQFDPEYAQIMIHFIDQDSEYLMKERVENENFVGNREMYIDEYRSEKTDGILITNNYSYIRMHYRQDKRWEPEQCLPSLILFDALDGQVHDKDEKQSIMHYFEYGEIRFDGKTACTGARKMQTEIQNKEDLPDDKRKASRRDGWDYEVKAVRLRDHASIIIEGPDIRIRTIVALADSSRYAYLSLTGEHCCISEVKATRSEKTAKASDVPKIAEEVVFTDGPEGDIPNIQIDDFRSDATVGIPVGENLRITFRGMSLPSARLISHCPFAVLYTSDDRRVRGRNYREIAVTRADGENWRTAAVTDNKLIVNKKEDFVSWEEWKIKNKEGIDCVVTATRDGDTLIVTTEVGSVFTRHIMTLESGIDNVLLALSGDQVVMSNIRIA